MALEAYIMRHGETEANVGQILMGRGDSPFTEAGRRHPVQVAEHLRDRRLSRVYVSPQARAQRTAALVLKTLGRAISLETAPALAEIDAGEFEGLSFQQVRERVPRDAVLGEFRYPGGESWGEVQERAVQFLTGLESRHNKDSVLLVTHAGVIAGLVAGYLGEPIERYIRTRFNDDYLGRLTVDGGRLAGYEKVAGTVDSWY
jgi:broad specificity phosphatase PhoE